MNQFNNYVLLYINGTYWTKLLATVATDAITAVYNSKLFLALFVNSNGVTRAGFRAFAAADALFLIDSRLSFKKLGKTSAHKS